MPVGARKRLLVEVHGVATPTTVALPPPAVVVPATALPPSPPSPQQQPLPPPPPLKTVRSPRLSHGGASRNMSPSAKKGASSAAEQMPAPRSLIYRRTTTAPVVSAASLRARLTAQQQKQASPHPARKSLSPRPSSSGSTSPRPSLGAARARTPSDSTAGGGGADSDESFESGRGSGTIAADAAAATRAKPRSGVSPRRASSNLSGVGAGGAGIARAGRENLRSTIGGSGFTARHAKAAAAAAAAVDSAATAVEEATSSGGATGNRLPRKSASGIPRKLPSTAAAGAGSSRLTAPAASASSRFAGRSASIGGGGGIGSGRHVASTGAALRTVQVAADYDGEEDTSAAGSGSAGPASVDGSSKPQGDGAAEAAGGGKRSFIPRPSPKAGSSLVSRRSGRA